VDKAGPLWVSYDLVNWYQYAVVEFVQDPCLSDSDLLEVVESGTSFELTNADFCRTVGPSGAAKVDGLCAISGAGTQTVYAGLTGWVSADGTSYQDQELFCYEIQSVEVSIESHHPLYIMRQFSNQDLHLRGSNFDPRFSVRVNGDKEPLKVIDREHAYVRLPLIQSFADTVTFEFEFDGILSGTALGVALIDPPTFPAWKQRVLTTSSTMQIHGLNIFSELELRCMTDQVNDKYSTSMVY
jgi:hypothetical protein